MRVGTDESFAEEAGVPIDLIDDGVLWAINKEYFHPAGFALGYDRLGRRFLLLGDGAEPWSFDPATEAGKSEAFEALLDRAREANRG